jgi:N-acetylglutamate synthase-like GNAT family acetyltransferase
MSEAPAFRLRKAQESDLTSIQELVASVGINTGGIEWNRFLVAVDQNDRVLGCGQLKPHAGGITELASIAVSPEMRGKGIARAIIEPLLAEGTRPLYLMCESALAPLYAKFGFRSLDEGEMPTYFRRVSKLPSLVAHLQQSDEHLLVMKLE